MSSGSLVHMRGTANLNADGTGTVITPDGSYSGVLRVTGTRDEHDTIFGSPNITVHLASTSTNWYQPVLYYPVMAILITNVYYSNGFTIHQKSVGYRPGIPAGIAEQNSNGNGVYISPNPSSTGIFHFQLKDQGETISRLEITDLTSRVIYSSTGNVNEINLAGAAKGIYFYHIQTATGKNYSGKIMTD